MKIPRLFAGALSLLLVIGISQVARAQAFTHPGISHSQADLDRMKNNVNVEPYMTAYTYFAGSGYSSYNNTGQGPFTSEVNGGQGQFEIRNDAQVAHWNAVMWYVTGNVAYRTNSINLMMGWANTLTSFDVSDHITAGTCLYDFCNAAEIIRATGGGAWAPADITKFQNWMLAYLYPPLLTPGNSIAANQLEAAGHGGLQVKGLIALGIFCDRQDIYNFGISSYQHHANYSYGIQEYIDASGQTYEDQRDVGHSSGNVGAFTESAYMAYNQGLDLFAIGSNLLAKAYEIQAKFDMGWDVAPIAFTAADGGFHIKMSGDSRTAYDNLESDLAYHVYHDIKGLNMPYTKMSADLKFPATTAIGPSFFFRIDPSGQVPLPPLVGEPAPTGVRLYEDYLSGSYLTNFQPGNYTNAALKNGGLQANNSGPVSSVKVPIGWTVTAYSANNYTGTSLVMTGTLQNQGIFDLVALNFNDKLTSMKVVGGGTWPIFNTTYKIVNRNSGKVADVSGGSTADGASVVPSTYSSALSQLWRIENLGNGQYKFLDLNSNKAMEVAGASLTSGAPIDQRTYVPPPNLATGGSASASTQNSANGQGAAQAFDGNVGTKWLTTVNGVSGYLQYQFASGTTWAVNQYVVSSADDVPQRDPAAWQLQGSANGTTWTTLDTQTGQTFANRRQANIYNFTNTTAYAYYRLNVTANNGGASYGIQLSELGLYSTKTGGVQQRWTFTPASGSAYATYLLLQNVNSGLLLDGTSASTINQSTQAVPSASTAQQWLLQVP